MHLRCGQIQRRRQGNLMSDPFQQYVGIKASTLLAGFAGGVVRALMLPRITPWQAFSSCIVGALTAGYLTPVAMHWLPFADTTGGEGAVGYAIGLTSMILCEGIIVAARRWKAAPKLPTNGD